MIATIVAIVVSLAVGTGFGFMVGALLSASHLAEDHGDYES